MSGRTPQPKLLKSLFQARFKPKLAYHPIIFSQLSDVEAEYGDWLQESSMLVLTNFAKRFSLILRLDMVQHELDSHNLDSEKLGIGNAMKVALERFKVAEFERLYLRRIFLVQMTEMDFSSLVALLNVKLFSQETRLREAMPGSVKDLMYRLNTNEGRCQFNITVGPVRKDEIPNFAPFNYNLHLPAGQRHAEQLKILDSYPDVAVFFDMEYLHTDPKPRAKDAIEFAETARRRTEEAANSISEFVFASR